MPLESTLNALWVSIGFIAVCAALAAAYLRRDCRKSSPFQVLCVVLVVAALFPYISSTDDALRLRHLRAQQQTAPSNDRSHDNLMRLYEAMDAPVAGQIYRFVVAVFVVSVILLPALRTLERATPGLAGRSPPVSTAKVTTLF